MYVDPDGRIFFLVPIFAVAILVILVSPTIVNAPSETDPVYPHLTEPQLNDNIENVGTVVGTVGTINIFRPRSRPRRIPEREYLGPDYDDPLNIWSGPEMQGYDSGFKGGSTVY